MNPSASSKVAIVGLGYVGLPLAIEMGRKFDTIGFDVVEKKLACYRRGEDPARQIEPSQFHEALHLAFTADPRQLADRDFVIICVPTPVDHAKQPDFSALEAASQIVGQYLKSGAIVVYESTVYPGASEEICAPVLERSSGGKWKRDFFIGYSPERINPGDREHTLCRIVKVVAGDTTETLDRVAWLYGQIIPAGIHRASSIRVAEAAKVIENTQRDLNIALMNELAIIFERLGIDTQEVLAAAGTKWNFLKFSPGLVGGHCIGVDPYYLTHKAEMVGYHPQVILAGRRINDGMGRHVVERTIKQMIRRGHPIQGAEVTILGITFKENCGDIRNSRVIDVINELRAYGLEPKVFDPLADASECREEYGVQLTALDSLPVADALILAVGHAEFAGWSLTQFQRLAKAGAVIADVRGVAPADILRAAGYDYWRL